VLDRLQTSDRPQQRTFAAPTLPQQDDDFTSRNVHVELVDYGSPTPAASIRKTDRDPVAVDGGR
jgi:hypothetical protein